MFFNIFAGYLGQKLRYFAFFKGLWPPKSPEGGVKKAGNLKSSLNNYTLSSSPPRRSGGGFIRAWCNGSIRVSKTFDLGSNPSARAD